MSALAAVLLGLAWLLVAPPSARADGEDWRIDDYKVVARVDSSGTTAVQLDLSFNFGSDPGHGPLLAFPVRQVAADPNQWRMIDISLDGASSPSGANAEVASEVKNGNLVVRIGNERKTFTGVQTYRINYRIRGLIAPKHETSGLDEFNWQIISPEQEVPVGKAAAEVSGPVGMTRVACFVGRNLDEPCDSSFSGSVGSFAATRLGEGSGLQVVAGFPAGTFVGAEPRMEKRVWIGNMFPINAATASVTGLLAAAGVVALVRRTRRSRRDEVYLGLTPGVAPAPGQDAATGRGDANAPVAVAFQPPAGARPGEIGTLMDASADERDITATLVDLAVRGHLTIAQEGKKDFTFTSKQSDDPLVSYEKTLLSKLFASGGEVTTDELRDESYAGMLPAVRKQMYGRVTRELGWYAKNPSGVRAVAIAGGVALVGVGAALGFALGLVGWGLVGLAPILVGFGVLIMNNKFGSRTAMGSAVLAQAKGFELYLTTAEAEQIKFEEGIDVFSRYLPYAMVFGVADRWTKVFEQLATEGRYEFAPYWYYGFGYGHAFGMHDLSNSLDSLASSVSSSLQSANAATSGGSGFSGGGGFGGGTVGGW